MNNLKNYYLKGSYLPFLIGLLSGLYFITLKVVGYSFEFLPGDFIDGRFNNYILEHAYQFFTFQISEFWNAPFMFPEKDVVSYSDNLLGTAPFYSVFRILGFDRETAFQLWYMFITILNYTAAYLLLKYIFKNRYASSIGAMIFAFSLALQSQVGHAQTYTRFPMALCILSALIFSEELNAKWFFITVFCLVYQMYCGIYLGFLLLFPLATILLVIIISNKQLIVFKLKDKSWLLKMIMGLIANVLLLLPLMLPYLARAKQLGFYNYKNIVHSLPTPLSYFFSWNGSLLWDSLRETCIHYPAFWDHEIFAGGLAVLGVVYFIFVLPLKYFKKNKNQSSANETQIKLLWFTAVLTFLFFIRFNESSLYRILFKLPGFGSMRALQRIINFELIFFAIGLACLVNLITVKKSKLSFTIFIVLVLIVIADNFVKEGFIHQKSKTDSQLRIEALANQMHDFPKTSLVSYEPDSMVSNPADYHLDAMMACQLLKLKTLNGYSATSPAGYDDYWVKPNAIGRRNWLAKKQLDSINVKVIK